MKELSIVAIENELRTDSRLLAGHLDHRHRTILENIDKHSDHMRELGGLPFETERGVALAHGGFAKSTRYAMLNEDQCYFLLTLMRNNSHVVQAKLNLVKSFSNARAQLAHRDIARVEGKAVRRSETDSIKMLVDYASANGSKSANRYYTNVTKMTNELLGIESGQRDTLPVERLKQISVLETVVDIAIRDGVKAKMQYKDIYKLAKERASHVMQAIGAIGGGV